MLCEICQKNQATIHIQEIVAGKKKALHICSECASKKQEAGNAMFNGFNLAEILYNISSQMNEMAPGSAEQKMKLPVPIRTCTKCGWNSTKFRETGRLGCGECYNVFRDILLLALRNMHKGTVHVGKVPGENTGKGESSRTMLELMELQRQIDEAVLREDYEKAAGLRDRINEIRGVSRPAKAAAPRKGKISTRKKEER